MNSRKPENSRREEILLVLELAARIAGLVVFATILGALAVGSIAALAIWLN